MWPLFLQLCAATPSEPDQGPDHLRLFEVSRNAETAGNYELAYRACSAALMAGCVAAAAGLDSATAQPLLGYTGVAVVIAMFSGPLTVMKEVIDTKSTKNMPLPLAVATVVNCTLWASFGGLVVHDPFIWGPNILGFFSGVTQVGLIAKYGVHKAEVEAAPAADEVAADEKK